MVRAYVVPPRLNAAGHSSDHPHARFRGGLTGHPVRGAAVLIHRHALRGQFVPAHERVDAFAGVAVLLETGGVVAPLVVQHHDVSAAANSLQVPEGVGLRGHGAAVHAGPDTVGAARSLRSPIVQVPELRAPVVVPQDPLPVGRIIPIGAARYRLPGLRPELALAVLAIADATPAHSRPTVIGDPLRVRPLDDFTQHVRQVLVVVGAVDARDVLVVCAIRLSFDGTGEPVGMRLEEILRDAVGVHARHHDKSVLVSCLREIAVQVPPIQELRAMMQREFAGIVSYDAAGVNDDALYFGALPVLPPPRDIILIRILFRDVGLSPAISPQIPRLLAAGRCLGNRVDRQRGQRELEERSSRVVHGD